jgi:hypothetical protein
LRTEGIRVAMRKVLLIVCGAPALLLVVAPAVSAADNRPTIATEGGTVARSGSVAAVNGQLGSTVPAAGAASEGSALWRTGGD